MSIDILNALNGFIDSLGTFLPKELDEDKGSLRIEFQLRMDDSIRRLITLRSEIQKNNFGKCFLKDVTGSISFEYNELKKLKGEKLTFVFLKEVSGGHYFFFSREAFGKALKDTDFIKNAKSVMVSGEFATFSSMTTDFIMWSGERKVLKKKWQGEIDPRKLVKNYSSDADLIFPTDIRPWLLFKAKDVQDSNVLNIWKEKAAFMLSLVLPSEVNCSKNKQSYIRFKGVKGRTVNMPEICTDNLSGTYDALYENVYWIYSNSVESESKHIMLNDQLAFEWTESYRWPDKDLLKKSLVSAKEAYKLHLHKCGKELLEAMTEIKQSLHEEVKKVSENTKNIVTHLWRDFAIAAAVWTFNVRTGTTNMSEADKKILFTATAIFLILSIAITLISNYRFTKISTKNREEWQKQLYPFLSKQKEKELVKEPIKKGRNVYRAVVTIVLIIYLCISFYMLNLAFHFL